MIPSYAFESPAVFLADFGVPATFGALTAQVIFDEPAQEELAGRVLSTEYTFTFRSSDLPGLVKDSEVTIGGNMYYVQYVVTLDDGVFSRAHVQLGA